MTTNNTLKKLSPTRGSSTPFITWLHRPHLDLLMRLKSLTKGEVSLVHANPRLMSSLSLTKKLNNHKCEQ